MALQLGALRDALLDAGAAPDKAAKASEELAGYDTDIALLKWVAGASLAVAGAALAVSSTTLWFVLRLVAKVGA
jgi:hypothetical protein